MKIGRYGGIDVHIHWTFWLLIALYLVPATLSQGILAGLYASGFVLAVFACVLLHEFGHALSAKTYGIPTVDITLLPIGGVARLAKMPDKPWQELVVALAGPAVNVVIAIALAGLMLLGVAVGSGAPMAGEGLDFMYQLLAVNIFLVLFNMLPAFPMDGGRVLRSLLAMKFSYLRATQIAAKVGRWMALAFAIVGVIYGPFMLILIAGFIFLAGTAELMSARVREMAQTDPSAQFGRWQRMWPQSADFGTRSPDRENGATHWAYDLNGCKAAGWSFQGTNVADNPAHDGNHTNPANDSNDLNISVDVVDAVQVRQIR